MSSGRDHSAARWAVVAMLLVGACGGGSDISADTSSTTSEPRTEEQSGQIEQASGGLTAPEGWLASPDGLVVAELDDDLVGTDPAGQRVVDITEVEIDVYVDESDIASTELAGQPVEFSVDGAPALAVTMIETTQSGFQRATSTVIVDTEESPVRILLVQGPAASSPNVEDLVVSALAADSN